MQCPKCKVGFNNTVQGWKPVILSGGADRWMVYYSFCPTCEVLILKLSRSAGSGGSAFRNAAVIYPVDSDTQRRVSEDVPARYANEYREASATLSMSPKASAALSRRLLQQLLVDVGGAKKGDKLHRQITHAMAALPGALHELDAIRKIGNFAAHPNKDANTGEILEVEAGEAEWLLDILEDLLDHYFVKPAKSKARQEALAEKLGDKGTSGLS